MRRTIVPLLCLSLAGGILTSACRTEMTVRRRNWPQGTGTNDSSAMATGDFAPAPASPCGWIPPSEVAGIAEVTPAAPRPQDSGCFYPLGSDSSGVLVTVTLPPDAAAGSGMGPGWTEDVTRWSPPVAFAGRTGDVRIEVAATGSAISPQQVRAIADRVRDRNRTPTAAPTATAEQVTTPAASPVVER